MIGLRAIDRNNWEQCIHLKPAQEQQRFIASNLYSIAESQFLPGFVTRAVYLDDRPIGFTMYGKDPDDGNYWIYRFMIDERYQGKGYGTAAIRLVIDDIEKKDDRTDVVVVGYHPDNEFARKLYTKAGFQEIGIAPWGEMLANYHFEKRTF
jgi:Acetyltransferases, including N-acetylases of ribosomal proteins